MEFEIRSEQQGTVCSVAIDGEIDVYTAPQLRERIITLIDGGCTNVIVDLSHVGFIDSSGLGVLVSALRRARERDGSLLGTLGRRHSSEV
jgi:anti-sigma B factor antagonist